MSKWLVDTNILYYMSEDDSILERLKAICPNLFWSEISLEELIAGADTEQKYEILKDVFKITTFLNLIVPDTQSYLTEEWFLDPSTNMEEYSCGLMKAVDGVLKSVNFDQIRSLVKDSKELCEAKREIFNKDFSEIVETEALNLQKDGINIKNEDVRNIKILEMFYSLIKDENLKKLLFRIKKTAYSVKNGLLNDAGFDVKSLRELSNRENSINVPEITEPEFLEKKKYYECYTRVYAGYCARRMYQTSKSKYKNDSHDLDIMKYLSRGFSIVTSEKRWVIICKASGLITKYLFRTAKGIDVNLIQNEIL